MAARWQRRSAAELERDAESEHGWDLLARACTTGAPLGQRVAIAALSAAASAHRLAGEARSNLITVLEHLRARPAQPGALLLPSARASATLLRAGDHTAAFSCLATLRSSAIALSDPLRTLDAASKLSLVDATVTFFTFQLSDEEHNVALDELKTILFPSQALAAFAHAARDEERNSSTSNASMLLSQLRQALTQPSGEQPDRLVAAARFSRWWLASFTNACYSAVGKSDESIAPGSIRNMSDCILQMLSTCIGRCFPLLEPAVGNELLQEVCLIISEARHLSTDRADELMHSLLDNCSEQYNQLSRSERMSSSAQSVQSFCASETATRSTGFVRCAASLLDHNLNAVENHLDKLWDHCLYCHDSAKQHFLNNLIIAYSETRRMSDAIRELWRALATQTQRTETEGHELKRADDDWMTQLLCTSSVRPQLSHACANIAPGQMPELINCLIDLSSHRAGLSSTVFLDGACELACTVLDSFVVPESQKESVCTALNNFDLQFVIPLLNEEIERIGRGGTSPEATRPSCALRLSQSIDALAKSCDNMRVLLPDVAPLVQSCVQLLELDIHQRSRLRITRAALSWLAFASDELNLTMIQQHAHTDECAQNDRKHGGFDRNYLSSVAEKVVSALERAGDEDESTSGIGILVANTSDTWIQVFSEDQLRRSFIACLTHICDGDRQQAFLRALCSADLMEVEKGRSSIVLALGDLIHANACKLVSDLPRHEGVSRLLQGSRLGENGIVTSLRSVQRMGYGNDEHDSEQHKHQQLMNVLMAIKSLPDSAYRIRTASQYLCEELEQLDCVATLHCLTSGCSVASQLLGEARSATAAAFAASDSNCQTDVHLVQWFIRSAEATLHRIRPCDESASSNINAPTARAAFSGGELEAQHYIQLANSFVKDLRKQVATLQSFQASRNQSVQRAFGMVPRTIWHSARAARSGSSKSGPTEVLAIAQAAFSARLLEATLRAAPHEADLIALVSRSLLLSANEVFLLESLAQQRTDAREALQSLFSVSQILLHWRWRQASSKRRWARLSLRAARMALWSGRLLNEPIFKPESLFSDAAMCFAECEQQAANQPLSTAVHSRIRSAFLRRMERAITGIASPVGDVDTTAYNFRRYIYSCTIGAAETCFRQMLQIATNSLNHHRALERCRAAFILCEHTMRGHPTGRSRRFLAPLGEELLQSLDEACRRSLYHDCNDYDSKVLVVECLCIIERMTAKRVSHPMRLEALSALFGTACRTLDAARSCAEVEAACGLIVRVQRSRGENMQKLHCISMNAVRSGLKALQMLEARQGSNSSNAAVIGTIESEDKTVEDAGKAMSRLLEAAAQRTDRQRGYFCAHALALVASAFTQPLPESTNIGKRKRNPADEKHADRRLQERLEPLSRQMQRTLRLGTFALLDKCGERELAAVHKQLGTGEGSVRRWALSMLREEHARMHKFTGKY